MQDSEPSSSSSTAMASSSKPKTNIVVKESNDFNYSGLDPKTEALYAFRTIMTMLSLIHSTRRTAGNRPNPGRQEKGLLQLLDVFAAVLLRNNGIIAVTASNGHGNPNPCGIAGTGVTRTGTDEQTFIHDVPIPL